jgi:hypothetical protein
MGNKIVFGVLINELQNVIQSIVVLQQTVDELNSLSSKHFFVVLGEGHGHGGFLRYKCNLTGFEAVV